MNKYGPFIAVCYGQGGDGCTSTFGLTSQLLEYTFRKTHKVWGLQSLGLRSSAFLCEEKRHQQGLAWGHAKSGRDLSLHTQAEVVLSRTGQRWEGTWSSRGYDGAKMGTSVSWSSQNGSLASSSKSPEILLERQIPRLHWIKNSGVVGGQQCVFLQALRSFWGLFQGQNFYRSSKELVMEGFRDSTSSLPVVLIKGEVTKRNWEI